VLLVKLFKVEVAVLIFGFSNWLLIRGNGLVKDDNRRIAVRTKLRAGVTLTHPDVGDLKLHTVDVSDTGAFILSEGNQLPVVGELVTVQVQGMGGEEAPLVKMKVARVDKNGIGLQFVDE
jgi:hypothetical protein